MICSHRRGDSAKYGKKHAGSLRLWYANRYARGMKPKAGGSRSPTLRPETRQFYLDTMRVLREAGIEFLVGGAYAFAHYVGIGRNTKDFDLFLRPRDVPRALDRLRAAGCDVKVASPLWLAKSHRPGGEEYVDLIFNSGNGLSPVEDSWFVRAGQGKVLGEAAPIIPVEEMIWTKAFIQERERFDGADVAHLLLARGAELDWKHLQKLFGGHEQVLLAHLIMFSYIYPSQRDAVPAEVIESLMQRVGQQPEPKTPICRGTSLSRGQYLVDVRAWGFADARIQPAGPLSPEQVEELTSAIDADQAQWTWSEAEKPGRLKASRRRRLGKTG